MLKLRPLLRLRNKTGVYMMSTSEKASSDPLPVPATAAVEQNPIPPDSPLCLAKFKKRTAETHQQHIAYLKSKAGQDAQVLMLGSSMVERFTTTGVAFMPAIRKKLKIALAGVGGDRVENMVYRVHHGLLDDFKGNTIFVMSGCNNIERHTAPQVAEGVQYLVDMILAQRPEAKVVVFGMLPRDMQKPKKKFGHADLMKRVEEFNQLAQRIKGAAGYRYFGGVFRGDNGLKKDAYYDDHVHLNEAGYRVFYSDLCDAVAECTGK